MGAVFTYLLGGVSTCPCVWVCMHAYVHAYESWRPRAHILLILFLEAGSVTEREALLIHLDILAREVQGPSSIYPHIQQVGTNMPGFYIGAGDMNSRLHVYTARSLLSSMYV